MAIAMIIPPTTAPAMMPTLLVLSPTNIHIYVRMLRMYVVTYTLNEIQNMVKILPLLPHTQHNNLVSINF